MIDKIAWGMPMKLAGSCHCGAVKFTVVSHTPYPFMRCYCSICRKTGGGGGYAINIMGTFKSKATKSIRAMGYRSFDWQDRFHDHILKNVQELEHARTYIRENPRRWETTANAPITSTLGSRDTVP